MRSPIGVPGPTSVKILLSSRDVAISVTCRKKNVTSSNDAAAKPHGQVTRGSSRRVKSIDLDPDPLTLDMRRPHLHGLGAGRIGRLPGADEESALMKRAFDLLADDRALAERARPMAAFIDADEVLVAELVDGISLVIDHGTGRELAAHFVGAADHQLAHGSAKLKAARRRFNGRDDVPRVAPQPAPSAGNRRAAVDDDGLTGDEAAFARSEQHRHAGDVFRLAEA